MGSFSAWTMKEHVGKWCGDIIHYVSTKENIAKIDI